MNSTQKSVRKVHITVQDLLNIRRTSGRNSAEPSSSGSSLLF
jgi:hypothetical protein